MSNVLNLQSAKEKKYEDFKARYVDDMLTPPRGMTDLEYNLLMDLAILAISLVDRVGQDDELTESIKMRYKYLKECK